MPRLNLVADLGAPAVVAVADILTTEQKPTWNRPVGIGLAAVGYVLGYLGMGGPFVKNLGIAAAPWAFESIYHYIKETTGATARVGVRPVGSRISRYPAPATEDPFGGTRLV